MAGIAGCGDGSPPARRETVVALLLTLASPAGLWLVSDSLIRNDGDVSDVLPERFSLRDATANARTLFQHLWSDGRGPILVTVSLGWFIALGVRFMYPVLVPSVRTAFDMDLTTAGALLTALWLAHGLGQFPGGLLIDYAGDRAVLVGSTLATGIGLVLVALSFDVLTLFLWTILVGFTTALYGPARYNLTPNIYPDRAGTANGTVAAIGNVGSTVLPIVAGVTALYVGWQLGFALLVPVCLVVAAAIWRTVPKRTATATFSGDRRSLRFVRTLTGDLFKRSTILGTAVLVITFFILQGLTGFLPTYFIEMKGLQPTIASGLYSVFFGSGIVMQLVTGMLNDRIGSRWTLAGIAGAVCVGSVLLPFVTGIGPLLLLTILLSALVGSIPVGMTYLANAIPDDVQGIGLGVMRTVFFLLGSMGSFVVGSMADHGYFDAAFLLLGGLAIVTVLLALSIPDGRSESLRDVVGTDL